MSSLSDVNVTAPVQPQSTSTAAGSLFAGLSVKSVSSTQAPSVSSNLMMASTSFKPPESVTNVSNMNTLPQSRSVTHNQPVASGAARASSNTAQPTSGILQPQLTPVTQNQPSFAAGLNATSTHLPNSAMLQPQPATSLYNNTISKPTQTGMTYQPPPIAPTAKTIGLSVTEEPPPYPGHETASNFRMGTQQMMPSPIVPHQMSGSSQSATQSPANVPSSFSTNVLQPQPPNVLQPQGSYPRTNMLQPQQPHISGTGNTVSSLSTSNPMQMRGAPRVTMQGSGHVIDPRGHNSVTGGVSLPQHPSMVSSTPAGLPQGGHTGMNVATTTGLFQQPLIAAPSAATSQGSRYKMAPGVNPFSDINDLL